MLFVMILVCVDVSGTTNRLSSGAVKGTVCVRSPPSKYNTRPLDTPFTPSAPVGPWMPCNPVGPWGPVGPIGPVGPVAPTCVYVIRATLNIIQGLSGAEPFAGTVCKWTRVSGTRHASCNWSPAISGICQSHPTIVSSVDPWIVSWPADLGILDPFTTNQK